MGRRPGAPHARSAVGDAHAAFQPAAIDLAQLVVNVEPLLARLVRGRVKLKVELDRTAGQVRADPTQLEQVLMNLVVNARDAVADGGVVTVSTSLATDDEARRAGLPPRRYAVLAVRDTGPGISAGLARRIFEPFFRRSCASRAGWSPGRR